MTRMKQRMLWALYIVLLVAGICGVLKAAAARDRQYMERFGGLHQ